MRKYFPVENYTMKCRLYPNKTQAKQIDDIIHGVHVAYNMILHDMLENGMYQIEKDDKNNPGFKIHFPRFSEGTESKNLKRYRENNSCVSLVPANALSSKSYGICADMKRAWESTGKYQIERFGDTFTDERGNTVTAGCRYYCKKHPRQSFKYQIDVSNKNFEITNNRNVFKIRIGCTRDNLDGVGLVKVRGWNQNIKFDEQYKIDFIDWIKQAQQYKDTKVTVRIKKDNCDCYWICFSFPLVFKPLNIPDNKEVCEGVDVGEINLATLSSGKKYESYIDANKRCKKIKKNKKHYQRKLSRSCGWANESFRKNHKKDKTLEPSKTYLKYDMKDKKASAKIKRVRENYYHNVTAEIIASTDYLGIEGLRIKDMFHQKDS